MSSAVHEPLNRLFPIYRSLIGKKILMAVTGLIGAVYVFTHMLGNLQVFAGPKRLNAYAALLKSNDEVLWSARIILLAADHTYRGVLPVGKGEPEKQADQV